MIHLVNGHECKPICGLTGHALFAPHQPTQVSLSGPGCSFYIYEQRGRGGISRSHAHETKGSDRLAPSLLSQEFSLREVFLPRMYVGVHTHGVCSVPTSGAKKRGLMQALLHSVACR